MNHMFNIFLTYMNREQAHIWKWIPLPSLQQQIWKFIINMSPGNSTKKVFPLYKVIDESQIYKLLDKLCTNCKMTRSKELL